MRTAQPKTAVMIAESTPMSKPRMEQGGIRRAGWRFGNSQRPKSAEAVSRRTGLVRNLAEETGDGCDDDKSCEKPGERAEAMVLERLSSA
jgi:hypothetical protein